MACHRVSLLSITPPHHHITGTAPPGETTSRLWCARPTEVAGQSGAGCRVAPTRCSTPQLPRCWLLAGTQSYQTVPTHGHLPTATAHCQLQTAHLSGSRGIKGVEEGEGGIEVGEAATFAGAVS